jgi:uncharacterized protein (DUF1778 family)
MKSIELKQSRFELRLSENDKKILEKASAISGYTTLTNFVLSIIKKQAAQIIDEHERILASEKDKEIFFNAILANNTPNESLKNAVKKYSDTKLSE